MDLVVAVEVCEPHWKDVGRARLDAAPQPLYFPLGDELVTVQQDAPVSRALLTRAVLELDMPGQGVCAIPLVAEHRDLRIEISDRLVRAIGRHALVDDDL